MKNWYDIILTGRVTKYDVIKTTRIAVHSSCDWPDDKLAPAVAEHAASEPGIENVKVASIQRMQEEPRRGDRHFDRVVNLDATLGI